MAIPVKERVRRYREKNRSEKGGKTLSVWISEATAQDIDQVKTFEDKTIPEIVESALKLYHKTLFADQSPSESEIKLSIDTVTQKRLRFLKEVLQKPDTDKILVTGIEELYLHQFNMQIQAKAVQIRNRVDEGIPVKEQAADMKQLVKWLYMEIGRNEKLIKDYLVKLNVPPIFGSAWRVSDVRRALTEWGISTN